MATRKPHNTLFHEISEGGEYNSLIPEKKYFKISEVCEIAGLKQHVLRYWESEFKKMIRPHRASSKQRLYRRVDVENILTIKKLLKEDGFTIPGAKKFLSRAQEPKQVDSVDVEVVDQKDFLSGLKSELIAIQKILKGK